MLAVRFRPTPFAIAALAMALTEIAAPALAQDASAPEDAVVVRGQSYGSWAEYFASPAFRAAGGRCATPTDAPVENTARGSVDCTATNTNPLVLYEPDGSVIYEITVVVHIIMSTDGTQGVIPDVIVDSQIQVLNEDFRAMAGSNGENGHDAEVRFVLASLDPSDNPTTGITRSQNDAWFADSGNYWETLAWNPRRYLNIYTNEAGGALGYVPFIPQEGPAGTPSDRVVILWSAFGSPSIGPPPYHLGRTVTHEVGHYLGLHHPFRGACADGTPPNCYISGDLICDTPSLAAFTGSGSCDVTQSCKTDDPVDNYMNYSDDVCMTRFTVEQVRRLRCTLWNYRPTLYDEKLPTQSRSWSSLKGAFRNKNE